MYIRTLWQKFEFQWKTLYGIPIHHRWVLYINYWFKKKTFTVDTILFRLIYSFNRLRYQHQSWDAKISSWFTAVVHWQCQNKKSDFFTLSRHLIAKFQFIFWLPCWYLNGLHIMNRQQHVENSSKARQHILCVYVCEYVRHTRTPNSWKRWNN